jgi:signal transduction histidine kinase
MASTLITGAHGLSLDMPRLLRDYGEQLMQRLTQKPLRNESEVRAVVQELALQFTSEQSRAEERGVRASGAEYNRWIGELFDQVDRGCSHEELIGKFLEDLASLIADGKSDALFGLVIDQVTDGLRPIGYRLGATCGPVHAEHWKNFSRHIDAIQTSSFLDGLFAQEESVPLQLAEWLVGYDKILDSFVRAVMGQAHRALVADAFWLTAVSLVAPRDDEPRRTVFLAYRNVGSAMIPNPGKGAGFETRVLDVLRIAYGQIAKQEAAMRSMLVEERDDIVKSLYPSIYSHDFQTPVGNIHAHTAIARRECLELTEAAVKLGSVVEPLVPNVIEMLNALGHVTRSVAELHLQMKAYAALEALQVGRWPLIDGVDIALSLVQKRLKTSQVDLTVVSRKVATQVEMETDQGMFLVVLVNLIHNAVNMMDEGARTTGIRPNQLRRIRIEIQPEPKGRHLQLVVANTDTLVLPEHRERIFKKGFSTRSGGGGGRGLFLCRQICAHLGGRIDLMQPAAVASLVGSFDFKVAFSVRLPTAAVASATGRRVKRKN